MNTKYCLKCNQDRDISSFSKRANTKDGLQYWCKACMALHSHTNQDRRVMYNRQYQQRRDVKIKQSEKIQRQRLSSDPRCLARDKLQTAVRIGLIKKPKICTICCKEFKPKQIHGHHTDYNLPYSVTWCCVDCHTNVFHSRQSQYL